MPSKLRKPPAYRHYKPTGQAVVRIDGRDYYLGRHGTEASQEAYRRLIAEWATSPRPAATAASRPTVGVDLTVNELMVAYWDKHVVVYYIKNGRPTSEQSTTSARRCGSSAGSTAPCRPGTSAPWPSRPSARR